MKLLKLVLSLFTRRIPEDFAKIADALLLVMHTLLGTKFMR